MLSLRHRWMTMLTAKLDQAAHEDVPAAQAHAELVAAHPGLRALLDAAATGPCGCEHSSRASGASSISTPAGHRPTDRRMTPRRNWPRHKPLRDLVRRLAGSRRRRRQPGGAAAQKVTETHARSFMPADAASSVAARQAATLLGETPEQQLNYVVLERDRPLDEEDRKFYDR